ncbi:histidine kinase [Nesterenkonia sp.]|uniref:sensor histidine kinase n=1 Tax=Nesterenkonia sp. TaxID=704201 RepID=UPI00260E4C1A|nr:histidine kinase [Nesterenkonia sp.]
MVTSRTAGGRPSDRRAGYVLIKCGKIALVLRLVCTYPVAVAAAEGGSLSEMVLLLVVVSASLATLLGWERAAPFISRHPLLVAVDIVLTLVIFASTQSPTAYTGYLGSTAVLIGLFFPTLGQVLLTALLAVGFLSVVLVISGVEGGWVVSPPAVLASMALFASATYVGRAMQRLQRQVDATVEQARSAAADAALGQERSRLARELHDSLVKSLEGISLQAKAMKMTGKAVEEATMISQAAAQAIHDSRQLLTDLRDASVPPLADSLQALVDEVEALYGVQADLDVENCVNLPLDIRYAAHKVAEEALCNAATHSGSQKLECSAQCSAKELKVTVRDFGRGFKTKGARKTNHYGLIGMQERAEEVQGKVSIISKAGQGTVVNLSIPLSWKEEV